MHVRKSNVVYIIICVLTLVIMIVKYLKVFQVTYNKVIHHYPNETVDFFLLMNPVSSCENIFKFIYYIFMHRNPYNMYVSAGEN